jgi:outer membrane biosynthesis protein TonB
MAVTRLERKGRKNKSRAKARVATIKILNTTPVVKNVDIEAIKAEFAAKIKSAAQEKALVKEASPKEEKAQKIEKVEPVVKEAKAKKEAEVEEPTTKKEEKED